MHKVMESIPLTSAILPEGDLGGARWAEVVWCHQYSMAKRFQSCKQRALGLPGSVHSPKRRWLPTFVVGLFNSLLWFLLFIPPDLHRWHDNKKTLPQKVIFQKQPVLDKPAI